MSAAAARPKGQAWPLVKSAAKGVVAGVLLYYAADMASDIYTFCHVRRKALERVRASASVGALVGEPYQPGAWYDGTLGFSHGDAVAHCTFQVIGATRTTDVVARAARRPGMRNLILYNSLGGGEWDLVTCQAMFPGEGGIAAPQNLMDPLPAVVKKGAGEAAARAKAAAGGGGGGGGAAAGECLPCQQQQQRQQQQQQQQEQAAGSWWRWLWGGSTSGGGSSAGSSSGGGGDSASNGSSRA